MKFTLPLLLALLPLIVTPAFPAAKRAVAPVVDESLPNVLILGDSISVGYTPMVRAGLAGKANVLRPNVNCRDTRTGLAELDKWLGERTWRVIHFNWGLHDLCYRHPDSKVQGNRDKVNGTLSVPLAEYEKNLELLVQRLERTGATLIWASSTVVPEGEAGRFAGDELRYNAAAARIMKKHGVIINDLHAATKAFAPGLFRGPGDVHFTAEGSAKLAAQVLDRVRRAGIVAQSVQRELSAGSSGALASADRARQQTVTLRQSGHKVATLTERARRVVFLGDSITHSGGYIVTLEAYFLTRHPQRRIEFLNLGLSSETVSGLSEPGHAGGKFPRPNLHERLGRVLAETKPDLVFACYGMNDGIYLPLEPERFAAFQRGMRRVHDDVLHAGAGIIHLTPPVFDESRGKGPGYAAVLDRYSEWLLAQQHDAGWTVVDVHGPMQRALDQRRRTNPEFTFARDGVHPDAGGHWVIARAILEGLGAADLGAATQPPDLVVTLKIDPALIELIRERQTLLKLAWLSKTRHQRPGVGPGLPLEEAYAQAGELDDRIAELLP